MKKKSALNQNPSLSPLVLPREERLHRMIGATKRGIGIRAFVVGIEGAGYFYFSSSSLLVDSLLSFLDIVTSLSLLFFIYLADKPPDDDHPFGHGRYEPIAGLQLAFFFVLTGLGLGLYQGWRLWHPIPTIWVARGIWIIPLGAVCALECAYRIVHKVAKEQNSSALLCEALHYRIDSLSSLTAMVALVSATFFPKHRMFYDHLGALIISLLMIVLGSYAIRQNIHPLVDRTPYRGFFDLVREAAMRVPGIYETEKLRIQSYGPDAHITIDVRVNPNLSVREAHILAGLTRSEIQKSFPNVRDVIVHVEPYFFHKKGANRRDESI